jgi:hypothetical protein
VLIYRHRRGQSTPTVKYTGLLPCRMTWHTYREGVSCAEACDEPPEWGIGAEQIGSYLHSVRLYSGPSDRYLLSVHSPATNQAQPYIVCHPAALCEISNSETEWVGEVYVAERHDSPNVVDLSGTEGETGYNDALTVSTSDLDSMTRVVGDGA